MADIFIDFTSPISGDGTTPAPAIEAGGTGAYNSLLDAFQVPGDSWWVRRAGSESTDQIVTIGAQEVKIIGWPVDGDSDFGNRPALGTSAGWDDDTNEYAEVSFSNTTAKIYFDDECIKGNWLARFKMSRASTSIHHCLETTPSTEGITLENVFVDNPIGTNATVALDLKGTSHTAINCKFYGSVDTPSGTGIVGISADRCNFKNTAFVFGEISDNNDGKGFYGTGEYNIFEDTSVEFQSTLMENPSEAFTTGGVNQFINLTWSDVSGKAILSVGSYTQMTNVDFGSTPTGGILIGGRLAKCTFKNLVATIDPAVEVVGTNNYINIDGLVSQNDSSGGAISDTSDRNTFVIKDFTSWATKAFGFTGVDSIAYSLNHGGVDGYWRSESSAGFIEPSSVVRTGGGTFSLYCEGDTLTESDDDFPRVGITGVSEVFWVSLATGANTVKMFGAYDLFPELLKQSEIIMEIEYTDAGGNRAIATTFANGPLTPDGSVWSSPSATLEAFSLSISVDLAEDQVCPIRIRGAYPYSPTGYMYLDPQPVLVV